MAMLDAGVGADFFDGLRLFADAANADGVPWLVVGATARILLLEKVYGWPAGLGTQDTDFAVQVGDWSHYKSLCERLARHPEIETNGSLPKRFRTKREFQFDLLPYGGIEENEKQVFWPPDRDFLMTVRGFAGAAQNAVHVRVNGELIVPVVSPAGLCALKLFAWQERGAQEVGRDAKDVAYLFRHIERLLPAEYLFEMHIGELEDADYDADLAALDVFGQQVAFLLENEERIFMGTFLSAELAQETDTTLVRDLRKYLPANKPERIVDMLRAFLRGMRRGY